ncbi:MAG TPA: DUF4331 domain-containing protein [Candidatus Limnocylindrales bacterium]|nr:DUF4331 domain-containing protein [Candidatus Limnocylindrales bacterium]
MARYARRALAVAGALMILVTSVGGAAASSHREAPLISKDAFADNTDTYVFISPSNPNNVVIAASWIPFEGPEGGPNYWEWDPTAQYSLNVDNDGDAVADFTYTLTAQTSIPNGNTFLYNTGPITSLSDADWNMKQKVTITEHAAGGADTVLVNNMATTPSNIGKKSTPNYTTLENQAIRTFGTGANQVKIYAGQTDDAFWVDLQIFDLLTLRGQDSPIGYSGANNRPQDSVSGHNVHTLALEIPISRLKQGSEPVLGVWASTTRDGAQVSRLGMPLVNEAVIPLALKDAFNTLRPDQDLSVYTDGLGADVGALLQKSVEDPELGRLLCGLYGVRLPADSNKNCSTEVNVNTPRSGRGDIFDIFLTGMVTAKPFTITTKNGPVTLPAGFNVNRPAGVQPAEMIRINTNIKGDLCSPTPSRLGLLGGDACGFPNGRRLTDDVVEIELLAVAGAAYQVLDGRDASFSFNPALIGVLTDGVDSNDRLFRSAFPYFAQAQSGQAHFHQNQMGPRPTPS